MSYRSRSRSPEYRYRRYSPSRPRSRSPSLPPRRYDDPPRRYDDYGPSASGRYDDRIPPPRRYNDEYSPPPGSRDRYEKDLPPRRERYEEEFPPRTRERYEDERSTSRGSREPSVDKRGQGYDERPVRGMAADREEVRVPKREPMKAAEPAWERGRDVEELAALTPTYEPQQADVGGRKGGRGPSEPSRDVIFLGIDAELTDSDEKHGALVDSVKIVRDRFSGASKCFGFAQFASVEGAEEFIGNNYPAILMPALFAHSDPKKVKIDFSTPLGAPADPSNSHGGQWSGGHHAGRPPSDAMRDIGSPGGGKRVLLLRGMNYHTTGEEVMRRISHEIARLVGKVGRERDAETAIVRVVRIVDREARNIWGFGFVELATPELALALLPFLISPASQPQGFLISQFPVAASFANPTAFVPIPAGPLGGEFLVRASRLGGLGGDSIDQPNGQWCGYWHEKGGAVETLSRGGRSIEETGDLAKITLELRGFLGELAGPIAPPPSTIPSTSSAAPTGLLNISSVAMQPIKISAGAVKEEEGIVQMKVKNILDDEEETQEERDTVLLSRVKGVPIITAPSSRKVAKNISKWNNKQNELAKPKPVNPNGPPVGLSAANAALGVRSAPPQASASTSKSPAPDDFEYTDISTLAATGKVACLLCQRQFKTEEVLRKHVAQSDLHKARRSPGLTLGPSWVQGHTNLLDSATREAGQRRKAAIPTTSASDLPKYRDRAAERRVAFNQPDKPLPEEAPSQPQKRKFAEGPKPPPPPPAQGMEPGKDEANVGNQLLAKMGWKTGSGLGREGEGRVDPVLVQQFENRAGLGASKGHNAGNWQGPGGFQRRALDMAKERYNTGSPGPGK